MIKSSMSAKWDLLQIFILSQILEDKDPLFLMITFQRMVPKVLKKYILGIVKDLHLKVTEKECTSLK